MQKAALLIATGMKLKDVAKECKVCPQTLSGWRSTAAFQILCNCIQSNILMAAKAKLLSLSSKAVGNLENLLDSSDEKLNFEVSKEVLKVTGIVENIQIGDTTIKEKKHEDMYDHLNHCELTDLQIEVEEAIQEASIVDI